MRASRPFSSLSYTILLKHVGVAECGWARRACSALDRVYFDIGGIKHSAGKAHHFGLVKFVAREDIDVYHAIGRPRVQADVAGSDDDKTGIAVVQRVAGFDIAQFDGTDLFHADARGILVKRPPQVRLICQQMGITTIKVKHHMSHRLLSLHCQDVDSCTRYML